MRGASTSERLQELANGETEPKRGFSGWIAGRSQRREYWLWIAPTFLAATTLEFLTPGLGIIFGPVILVAWIRRLHDLGLTGWIAPLVNIGISIVGWIEAGVMSAGPEGGLIQPLASLAALVVMGVLPGQAATNAYGPPPGRKAELAETFS